MEQKYKGALGWAGKRPVMEGGGDIIAALFQMCSDDEDVRVELRHNNDVVGSLQREGSC